MKLEKTSEPYREKKRIIALASRAQLCVLLPFFPLSFFLLLNKCFSCLKMLTTGLNKPHFKTINMPVPVVGDFLESSTFDENFSWKKDKVIFWGAFFLPRFWFFFFKLLRKINFLSVYPWQMQGISVNLELKKIQIFW